VSRALVQLVDALAALAVYLGDDRGDITGAGYCPGRPRGAQSGWRRVMPVPVRGMSATPGPQGALAFAGRPRGLAVACLVLPGWPAADQAPGAY